MKSATAPQTAPLSVPPPMPPPKRPGLLVRHELNAWTPELARFVRHMKDAPVRRVGWGTGSAFEYFHSRHPVPLAFSVDNDATRWGVHANGVPIVGPDVLRREDPERTLVIIYSGAWREILPQLAKMGFRRAVPAGALFGLLDDKAGCERLARAERLARRKPKRRPRGGPKSTRAIVVQGPIVPDITRYALSVISAQHPRDRIVLSTWKNTPPELLADVSRFVDDIVLSRMPKMTGIQNRNCQIVSTRAGLKRAKAAGAKVALKTRTDAVHLAGDLFDKAERLNDAYSTTRAQRFGRRGRIIVPQSFTRTYVPYHASDLMMLGAIEDLLAFWSAPLDLRPGLPRDFYPGTCSLREIALDGRAPESYLGVHYCQRIGRPVRGTVRDSWAYYRDLFAVVDNDWFGLLWLKNVSMPEARLQDGPRQLVDHAFWKRLAARQTAAIDIVPAIDPRRTTFRTFYEALP